MPVRALIIVTALLLASCASEYKPIYNLKADQAMKAATYAEAAKTYETSVNEKFHSFIYYDKLGDIANNYGEYGEAINAYTRSLAIMSSDTVNMKRAIAYFNLKYYEDAEYDFTSVMMISTKYKPQAYAWRAKTRLALGKYTDALADLDKAMGYSGESGDLDKTMAEVYLKLGNTDKAMMYSVKAVEASPNDPELYYMRGTVFYRTKDANQAINDYKKALELKPDYSEAKYSLAWIYATCPAGMYRDMTQAVSMAEEIYKSSQTGNNAILLAAAYASQNDFDRAVTLLKEKAEKEKDPVLQDDMRVYMKMYQEKKTLGTW